MEREVYMAQVISLLKDQKALLSSILSQLEGRAP